MTQERFEIVKLQLLTRIGELSTTDSTTLKRNIFIMERALKSMERPCGKTSNPNVPCWNIDKDGKGCVNPLSENVECPGFSMEKCKLYEPDKNCKGCGGR